MSSRFWFYLGSSILVAGLFAWHIANQNSLILQQARLQEEGQAAEIANLERYAASQTDERKLVSLAKLLRSHDKAVLKPLILRAYELNPNSRDITLLASEYQPSLKEKVKTLDPLYDN